MKWSSAAFLGLATAATADVGLLKPDVPAPAGCKTTVDGRFEVSIYSVGKSKRDLEKRTCGGEGTLVMTLKDSVLKDAKDRTGAIVANRQFQFDGPPQAGSIFTGGFSICNNGSLAIGGSTVFYRCLSGDFYNLYDQNWAPQCEPIEIIANFCDGNGGSGNGGGSNKVVGTSMVPTTYVTVIGDGQPQVHATAMPVAMCKDGSGQTVPCAAIPPVSQIGDGQIQGVTGIPPAPPVSQIGDGQIQAPKTAAPLPTLPTAAPAAPGVSPNPAGAQPPAGSGPAVPPVSQIGDGQIQAPTGPAPTAPGSATSPTSAVPTAAAEKVLPGLAAALLIAGLLL
ncbi:hypothetical protein E4U21_001481 [Claviceps maximensis]|nr:hypothetical protein E4U21_001481 [Claviceps maximensis]